MAQEIKVTFVLRFDQNPSFYAKIRAYNVGIMYERCRKRHSYTCFNLLAVNGLSKKCR